MKKIRSFWAAMLMLTLLTAAPSTAESAAKMPADIRLLLDEAQLPMKTEIQFDFENIGGAVQFHQYAAEGYLPDGRRMRVEVDMTAAEGMTEADWRNTEKWLETLLSESEREDDSESWAKNLHKAVRRSRRKARFSKPENRPIWARSDMKIRRIAVMLPYYPTLSEGVHGEDTRKLQEKLILLGYLDGEVDGFYGEKTADAVRGLERHIQALEKDVLDAQSETVHSEPETPTDGIADAPLQAYLYGGEFQPARETLTTDSRGEAVQRVQRRLIALGYLHGEADGHYGASTAQAVRGFRKYHGMTDDGRADIAAQNALFSAESRRPDRPVLAEGAGGEAVEDLQRRLKTLGFFNGAPDGDYGAATVRGVKALQKYGAAQDDEKTDGEYSGAADPLLLDWFYSDAFPTVPDRMEGGASNADVVRVQRRLSGLEYYFGAADGAYGYGTENAVRAFQKENALEPSGVAGQETLQKLFSEDAKKSVKPYEIKISIDKQRVYVYAPDANGDYTRLVRTMKCSTGKDITPTPKGTFQGGTGPGARWHFFKKFGVWAQYAYYIEGDIMFHSVIYKEKGGPVTQSSVNNLGRKASHGCVRLSVADAEWLYRNCPRNTKITIY